MMSRYLLFAASRRVLTQKQCISFWIQRSSLRSQTDRWFHTFRLCFATQAASNNSISESRTSSGKLFKDTLRHLPEGKKLEAGSMVEFRKQQETLLGIVEGQWQNRWVLYDQNGGENYVRGQDIIFQIPGEKYDRNDLSTFTSKTASLETQKIEAAWNAIEDTTMPLSVEKMAELLFQGNAPTDIYAAYALLKHDQMYFRQVSREPPLYFKMKPEQVEILQKALERTKQTEEEQQKFKTSISDALSQDPAERPSRKDWNQGSFANRIQSLIDFALYKSLSMENRNLAMECLRICEISPTPNGAVRLLESIGILKKHEPIALIRAGIQADFPQNILQASEELLSSEIPDPEASIRRDMRHLKIFSIDEAHTREIDDAIGIETLPDGRIKVWTHVSDPSRWVFMDSALDLEARNRVVSLYIPTGPIPMFPWKLAEGIFSLRAEMDCYALSFGAILKEDGSIDSCEIVPSIIRPKERLSYSEAQEAIDENSDEDLLALMNVSKKRKEWRLSRGAIEINLPECDVRLNLEDQDSDPDIQVTRHEQDTPTKKLVSEFMILAGEIAGRMGEKHGIALPYRSQAPVVPLKDKEKKHLQKGIVEAAALRSRMTRSVTSSTIIKPHASLGVSAYVQTTSPIRRYTDYLAHIQIKAFLKGVPPPLSETELDRMIVEITCRMRTRTAAESETVNYWLAEFFRQNQEKTWNAIVLGFVRQPQGMVNILIEDLGLERAIRMDRPVKSGEKITVSIAGVDVKGGMFRFQEVNDSKASLEDA